MTPIVDVDGVDISNLNFLLEFSILVSRSGSNFPWRILQFTTATELPSCLDFSHNERNSGLKHIILASLFPLDNLLHIRIVLTHSNR